MTKWRPPRWVNPYPEKAEPNNSLSNKLIYARIAFEAGADAMLEKLREEARKGTSHAMKILLRDSQ